MNKMKWMVLFMSITMIFSGCASMNNTGKGAAIVLGTLRVRSLFHLSDRVILVERTDYGGISQLYRNGKRDLWRTGYRKV